MESPDIRPGKIPRPNHERLEDTTEIDVPFWLTVFHDFEYLKMREKSVALYLNQPNNSEEGVL